MTMEEQYKQMKEEYKKYGSIHIPHEIRKKSNKTLEMMDTEAVHKEVFRRRKARLRRQLHQCRMTQAA